MANACASHSCCIASDEVVWTHFESLPLVFGTASFALEGVGTVWGRSPGGERVAHASCCWRVQILPIEQRLQDRTSFGWLMALVVVRGRRAARC